MKNTIKPLLYLLLILTFLIGNKTQVFGQRKVNITTGIGFPELLYLGAYYEFNQIQIGMSVGTLPAGSDETLISISGDIYYHFGGHSYLSTRRPWYTRLGLNYVRDETEFTVTKYNYLNIRVGRDLNITNKFGLKIGAGALFELSKKETVKKPSSGWGFNLDIPVIPSLGIGLFYKI